MNKWWWIGGAAAGGAYFLMKPKEASAADIDALLDDEVPVAPLPPKGTLEDPEAAAQALAAYLIGGGKFGTRDFPSAKVAEAQRVLMVADDGIVGPITRSAAMQFGVRIPYRPGRAATPVPETTLTPAARDGGAVEPTPKDVINLPKEQKGSLVARVVLSNLPSFPGVDVRARVEKGLRENIGAIGRAVGQCADSPQLVGSPSVRVTVKGAAMLADLRWPALWLSTGVSPRLKACLAQKLKGHPKISEYYMKSKITRS